MSFVFCHGLVLELIDILCTMSDGRKKWCGNLFLTQKGLKHFIHHFSDYSHKESMNGGISYVMGS